MAYKLDFNKLVAEFSPRICICEWSPVTSTTVDQPHIVDINLQCPIHSRDEVKEKYAADCREALREKFGR